MFIYLIFIINLQLINSMTKIRLTEGEIITLLEEIILLEAMSLDDIYDAHYSEGKRKEVPEDVFYKIAEADPTRQGDGMGKYTDWMIRLYRKGKLKMEDLYKATEYLTAFHKFKNRIEKKDIGQYKSLPELYDVVKDYIDNPDQATSKSDERRKIKSDAEKVYEDEKWLVIVPHTKEAAIEYGKGTQWCTAATSSYNAFDGYNEYGNLYININKRTGEKYQFQFETKQFKDARDMDIEQPIAGNIKLTRGLVKYYRDKFGDEAINITTKYDLNHMDKIEGLNGYCVYRPTKSEVEMDKYDDPVTSLIKYDKRKNDYIVVNTLHCSYNFRTNSNITTDSFNNSCYGEHMFYPLCLANRYVCIDDCGSNIVNLYDIVKKTFIFNNDDNITNIDVNDIDTSSVNYLHCTVYDKHTDAYKERIFSLKAKNFVHKKS